MALIASIPTVAGCTKSWVKPPILRSAEALHLGIAYGDTLTWLSDDDLADTLDDAVALGIRWVRGDLSWKNIQPDSPDAYEWERFDRVVDAAQERGLAVLPIVTYTPPWARPAGCSSEKCAPADVDQFAAFAGAAASRYPGIKTWEIWNEPNYINFWKPKPDPLAYANLLKLTAASIRKSNPAATVLIGGLANVNSSQGGMTPQDFLAVLVRSGATLGVGGLGLHYPNLARLQTIRSIFTSAGLPELPIWITEYGAPTGGEDSLAVTEERQAEIAADAVEKAAADPGVAALIWHTYHDSGSDPDDSESHYGLRRADGSKKPAYDAFQHAIANSLR
jgi:hypothetical protein